MPKKYNSAGKLQEYIPAGNGEPSGEYGTNKGTGNKHIKLEDGKATPNVISDNEQKQPPKEVEAKEKEKATPNVIDEDTTANGMSKKERRKNFIDRLEKSNKSNRLKNEYFITCFDKGAPEMQECIELVFERGLTISWTEDDAYCTNTGGAVCFNEKDIDGSDENYSKGGVFYHECGHALDASYNNEYNKYGVRLWASNSIVLSSGKTLGETLKSENTYNLKNNIFKEIENDFNAREKELYKENGFDADRFDEVQKKKGEMYKKYKIQQIANGENVEWLVNELTKNGYYPLVKEYNDLLNKKMSLKVKVNRQLNVEYGEVSDILSSMNYYRTLASYHSQSYWKYSATNKAKEFFAGCVSAKATNPKSYALLKKYYPKSVKAFEVLINKMKTKELKMI